MKTTIPWECQLRSVLFRDVHSVTYIVSGSLKIVECHQCKCWVEITSAMAYPGFLKEGDHVQFSVAFQSDEQKTSKVCACARKMTEFYSEFSHFLCTRAHLRGNTARFILLRNKFWVEITNAMTETIRWLVRLHDWGVVQKNY